MKKLIIFLCAGVYVQLMAASVAGGGAASGTGQDVLGQDIVTSIQFTSKHKAMLQKARVVNVVIINDWQEINASADGSDAMRTNLYLALNNKQIVLCTKSVWLITRKKYGDFVSHQYICKNVSDDYILFIPKNMQFFNKPEQIRDAFLGLSYTTLPDYNYKPSESEFDQEFEVVKRKSSNLSIKQMGEILFQALKNIYIRNTPQGLLPFFNIYFTGHGSNGIIAEVSAKTMENNGPSDFLKIMNFFDKNFRTQSVTLLTCFIGGKQIVDTYGMYDEDGRPIFNKYSNVVLDNFSFVIINIGTLYKVTYVTETFDFQHYFNLLNKSLIPDSFNLLNKALIPDQPIVKGSMTVKPVNKYEEILKYVKLGSVDNWVSVKLPHVSWFSAAQLKDETQVLSQVAMSATKKIVMITEFVKVIILEANYIQSPVIIDSQDLPVLMPVNYKNQFYYFKFLWIKNISSSIFHVLKELIFKNISVNEEVNFAFEKLQIGNTIYKNVHCFVHKDVGSNIPKAGFVYEDAQGRVFKYSWSVDSKHTIPELNDVVVKKQHLDGATWAEEFEALSHSILNKVSESLRPQFFEKLSNLFPSVETISKNFINLDDIANELQKKSLNSQDLKAIVPVLEQAIRNPNDALSDQIDTIFEELVDANVITSGNCNYLIPLLRKGFGSSLDFIEQRARRIIDALIYDGVVNPENWTFLIPVFKVGIKNEDWNVREDVAKLLKELVSKNIIFSLEKIKSLLDLGINDSDNEVNIQFLNVIRILSQKNLVTKADIQHFIDLASNSDTQRELEYVKNRAPEVIQHQIFKEQEIELLSLLDEKITISEISEKELNLLLELMHEGIITFDHILSLIEKTMSDPTVMGQKNSSILLNILFVNKLMTSDHVSSLLSFIERMVDSNNQSIQLDALDKIDILIRFNEINNDNLPEVIKLIEKCMQHSSSSVRLKINRNIMALLHKNILRKVTIDSLLPFIEQEMVDSDLPLRATAYTLILLFTVKDFITEADVNRLLPLLQAEMNGLNKEIRLTVDNIVSKLITKNLLTQAQLASLFPIVERSMSDSDSSNYESTLRIIKVLIDKKLIPQEYIPKFESLIQEPDLKTQLQALRIDAQE